MAPASTWLSPLPWVKAILKLGLKGEDRQHRLGDFEEVFEALAQEQGVLAAHNWYVRETFRSLAFMMQNILRGSNTMIKNYFKVALRKISRQRGYALINILGLSIGMAATLLILLWVKDEHSYDRFHANAPRIYRATQEFHYNDWHLEQCNTPAALASTIMEECPQAEMTTRLRSYGSDELVSVKGRHFNQSAIGIADADFFNLFTFPLVYGDAATVLKEPYTVAVSAKIAQRYFGRLDVVGEHVTLADTDFQISGVYEDMPDNSHFHMELLCSFASYDYYRTPNWGSNPFKTYILLRPGASVEALAANLAKIVKQHMFKNEQQYADMVARGDYSRFPLQPLTDIHLKSNRLWEFEANGNATYVQFFSVIAVFTLLIAAINYMNLATARSAGRSREVGIRKTMGSTRGALVRQFLSESVLTALLALVAALAMALLIMPLFRQLVGKPWLTLPLLSSPLWLIMLTVTALFIGVAAGLYPAFFLSGFQPRAVLAGRVSRGLKSSGLRSALVVFQFALSMVLLVSTLLVGRQMSFIQTQNLGYNQEAVLVAKTYGAVSGRQAVLRQELLSLPDVVDVSASSSVPGRSFNNIGMRLEGSDSGHGRNLYMADEHFADVMALEMAEGRYFKADRADDDKAVVINESMAVELNEANLLGKRLMIWTGSQTGVQPFTIIGIVRDFHYESFHESVKPLVMIKQYGYVNWSETYVSIKVKTRDMVRTVADITDTWEQALPGVPFNHHFLDSINAEQYQNEIRTGTVFQVFTFFAIFVACLGLLGLASFAAEQRRKEIGIRKVLGATIQRLTLLLTSEFGKWVLLATVLSWPVAWWLMHRWLQQFAYRTEVTVWPFVQAAAIIIMVTALTVGWHGLKAALVNPARSLRSE